MRQGWPILCAVTLAVLLLLAIQLVLIHTNSTVLRDITHLKSRFLHNLFPSNHLIGPNWSFKCNRSDVKFDICFVSGPTFLDPSKYTLFSIGFGCSAPRRVQVQPYPRKWDENAVALVKTITITSSAPPSKSCGAMHHSPALIFSAGGYTGNFFHDFNDGFIPLFITVNSFFSNRDFIFVIADCATWWVAKYGDLLSHFSPHPIINMDNESTTHCFPSATIGLVSHGYMAINPNLLHPSKTHLDFQNFLKGAYSKGKSNMLWPPKPSAKPHLILMTRKGDVGRVILNRDELIKAAIDIGFKVCVYDPTQESSLANAFNLIQRSHAMLGVHGAALTHSLFLRPGSVLIQVVPIGTNLLAKYCFENSARALGLEYMEYKIRLNESSLSENYGANSLVTSDPMAYINGSWSIMKKTYLDTNVKLDLVRAKAYLREAFVKAKILMDKEMLA